jgi:hypothetical protein
MTLLAALCKTIVTTSACLVTIVLVAGCASTRVTSRNELVTEKLPRPAHILVYDFAATPSEVPAESALANPRLVIPSPQTDEHIATGRRLGREIAAELVAEIRAMGLPAERASSGTTPRINDLVLRGYLLSFEEGSAAERVGIGFGSGASEVKTGVEGFQMTATGLRKLGSGTVEAGGSATPGAAVCAATMLATANPAGLIIVADHSDGMGFFPLVIGGDPKIMADAQGRKWHDMIHSGQGAEAALDIIRNFSKGTISRAIFPLPGTPAYRGAWQETMKAADEANEPGRFTAFIGYEWTSNTGGNNLHRNVIFRDNGAKALLVEPYTTMPPLGSDNPSDLWQWMTAYEAQTGGDVLAIAHNGHLSNGRMFPFVEAFGKLLDRAYAETRATWERLYEVTQTKGPGEAHPFLAPNDEFANFAIWDKSNLDGSVPKTKDMLAFEYARSGLKLGLKLEQTLGVNPYKFGMIGSSDAHTGLAAMEDENFFGKTTPQEPSPERMTKTFFHDPTTGVQVMDWEVSASGYAAVWATENTREAMFDAMERREAYATTGPRMIVRFFGGWNFAPQDARNRLPAEIGYTKGVPMGSALRDAPAGTAPPFLVAALKDPLGANLDRLQIIKGWLDAKGDVHEKVYDVVWGDADKRQPGTDGKLPPVGSTVGVANAIWTNTIGDPELITVWKDPDSTRTSAPSTTPGCSRSRRRAGPPTTPNASACSPSPAPRWSSRNAPIPHPSGTHRASRKRGAPPMQLLREPLGHFLLLGAVLFGVFAWVGDRGSARAGHIVITPGHLEHLTVNFTRTWQRSSTAHELAGLIDDYVREEVLYREAVALGLDRDDTIVRRRLRQKLEFLTEETAEAAPIESVYGLHLVFVRARGRARARTGRGAAGRAACVVRSPPQGRA